MKFKLFLLLFAPFSYLLAFDIHQMTIEEKVGQLFITYIEDDNHHNNAEKLIKKTKIGGVIYYNWSNDLTSPGVVQQTSKHLQALSKKYSNIPLLICTDQEGGLVSRLQEGFTEFPGNASLARTGKLGLAYNSALYSGHELRAVGVNFNLAPVVDINNNKKNPIIGIRSFGKDKEIVTAFGKKSVQGYKDAGIIPCLKHFPGHGDVVVDSHKQLPIVNKSYQEIFDLELFPFKALCNECPAIMTAHIIFPQIDPKNCATLSPIFLQKILREELEFQGVVISDSLSMQGVLKGHKNIKEVALKAFLAGNDLLLIGGRDLQNKTKFETNIDEIIDLYQSFLSAVKCGIISEERLNLSVSRILRLKEESGLFNTKALSKKDLSQTLLKKEHQDLAKEIAYRSIELKECDFSKDLSTNNITIVAPSIVKDKIARSNLIEIGKTTTLLTFNGLSPSSKDYSNITKNIENADYIIFCSYNAWKYSSQQQLLENISLTKPTACIAMRDSIDLDSTCHCIVNIAVNSPTTCSLDAAASWFNQKALPISISLEKANEIGQKVWLNECSKRTDQLTFWHKNEDFPSIGIGHFIWPPKQYTGTFVNGRFHKVLAFMNEKGAIAPTWLKNNRYCPYENREKFYKEFNSQKMKEFRAFLVESIPYQIQYMIYRLNNAITNIILSTPIEARQRLLHEFFELSQQKDGLYILIDYLNFKHEGLDTKERYCRKGWGLKQVMEAMAKDPYHSILPEKRFAAHALSLLKQRVKNCPNPEIQKKWIPGWTRRIHSYYDLSEDKK